MRSITTRGRSLAAVALAATLVPAVVLAAFKPAVKRKELNDQLPVLARGTQLRGTRLDLATARRILRPVKWQDQVGAIKARPDLFGHLPPDVFDPEGAAPADDWGKGIVLTSVGTFYTPPGWKGGAVPLEFETGHGYVGPGCAPPMQGISTPLIRIFVPYDDDHPIVSVNIKPPTPGRYAITLSMRVSPQGQPDLTPTATAFLFTNGPTSASTSQALPVAGNAGKLDSDQFTAVVTIPDPVPARMSVVEFHKPAGQPAPNWWSDLGQITVRRL